MQDAPKLVATVVLIIRASIPLIFALAAIRFFMGFLAQLRKGDRLQIVSHWGGLGGGLGGWGISNAFAFLLGAILFTSASVYLAHDLHKWLSPAVQTQESGENSDKEQENRDKNDHQGEGAPDDGNKRSDDLENRDGAETGPSRLKEV